MKTNVATIILIFASIAFTRLTFAEATQTNKMEKVSYYTKGTLCDCINMKPEKGMAFVYFGQDYAQHSDTSSRIGWWTETKVKIDQSIPRDGLVIGRIVQKTGSTVTSGSERERSVLIRVKREYLDGDSLKEGVYVYDGPTTYTTVLGAPSTIMGFHEMDLKRSARILAQAKELFAKNKKQQAKSASTQKAVRKKKDADSRRKASLKHFR